MYVNTLCLFAWLSVGNNLVQSWHLIQVLEISSRWNSWQCLIKVLKFHFSFNVCTYCDIQKSEQVWFLGQNLWFGFRNLWILNFTTQLDHFIQKCFFALLKWNAEYLNSWVSFNFGTVLVPTCWILNYSKRSKSECSDFGHSDILSIVKQFGFWLL